MPTWLKKQMQRAYFEKNRYQIKLLNESSLFLKKIGIECSNLKSLYLIRLFILKAYISFKYDY